MDEERMKTQKNIKEDDIRDGYRIRRKDRVEE